LVGFNELNSDCFLINSTACNAGFNEKNKICNHFTPMAEN